MFFLSEETLHDAEAQLEASLITTVSQSSVHAATKLLHLQPYKFKIVQKLQQADCISRTHF